MSSDRGAQGRLQWNRGGWLGSQLGGSCWMAVAGLLALPRDVAAGLIVLSLFATANVVGLVLWLRRANLSAYAAIQLLLAVVGLCGLAAIFVLERFGLFEEIQLGGRVSAATTYVFLAALVLTLMLVFHLRFGRSRGE